MNPGQRRSSGAPAASSGAPPRAPEGGFRKWPDGSGGWVVTAAGCHIWGGALSGSGYGLGRDPRSGRLRTVHRIRYEMEVGQVPDGLELDHFACDNRACCNPAHVRPASHRENTLRGNTFQSNNLAKTHCKNGHPLDGDNLVASSLATEGKRRCRVCHNARCREFYRRKQAKKYPALPQGASPAPGGRSV